MDEKLESLTEDYAAEIAAIMGENLISLVLYGSALTGEFVEGWSDLNFLMVMEKAGQESLAAMVKPLRKWRKRGVGLPLVMEQGELGHSLDSFPLEFLNIKSAYWVVRGRDLLAGMKIDPSDLRLQCEREIRGKLIQLRRAYLRAGDNLRDQEELFRDSIKTFIFIIRAMLWLEKVDHVPQDARQVIATAEKVSGLSLEHLGKVEEYKSGKPKLSRTEVHRLFGGYLEEVALLDRWIDQWTPGQGEEE